MRHVPARIAHSYHNSVAESGQLLNNSTKYLCDSAGSVRRAGAPGSETRLLFSTAENPFLPFDSPPCPLLLPRLLLGRSIISAIPRMMAAAKRPKPLPPETHGHAVTTRAPIDSYAVHATYNDTRSRFHLSRALSAPANPRHLSGRARQREGVGREHTGKLAKRG